METSNLSRFPVFVMLTWLVLLVQLVQPSSWLPSDEFLEVSTEEEESCEMGVRYKRDILGIFSNKRNQKQSVDLAANVHRDQVTPPQTFQFATNQPLPWQQANDASARPDILKPAINIHGDREVTPENVIRFTNQPEIFAPSRYPTTTPSPVAMNNFHVGGHEMDGFEVD